MMTGLAALGLLGLLIALSSSKGGEKKMLQATPETLKTMLIPDDAKAELMKLQSQNPAMAAGILGLFQMPPPPVNIPTALSQFMTAAYGMGFQTLAMFLGNRANDIMSKTTGKSGTVWNTWSNGLAGPDGTMMVFVYAPDSATPVITYSQRGTDQSTRRLVSEDMKTIPIGLPPDLVQKAHADFSV
jgi:hypothetical protein